MEAVGYIIYGSILLALCLVSLGVVLAVQIPKWRRSYPEMPVMPMVLGASAGAIVLVLACIFGSENPLLTVVAGSLAGGSTVGALAGRRGLEASLPVMAPALVTVGWLLIIRSSRAESVWLAVPAIAFIPLAAYMIGRVPRRTVRLVAAALLLAAALLVAVTFLFQVWAERRAGADEARAVQTDLTGAIERSGLRLVFEQVPDVEWQPVAPSPAAQASCYGTILSRKGKLDFTPGKLGIDLQLAAPIVMRVGADSALRIVDPASLRANGLRTDTFANLEKLVESGPLESVRHLGGPAQRFAFSRGDGFLPLGELYVRGNRARIEIFGDAIYEQSKVRWIADGALGDTAGSYSAPNS